MDTRYTVLTSYENKKQKRTLSLCIPLEHKVGQHCCEDQNSETLYSLDAKE